MGGDCLNVGCVPSKALTRRARAYAQVRDAGEFGVHVSGDASVDFRPERPVVFVGRQESRDLRRNGITFDRWVHCEFSLLLSDQS